LRAWRGEIGLYRAAYGLGGLGLVLVSLLGDALLSISAFTGGAIGWLLYIAGGAGELAFAWVSIVATWRAAHRGRPGGGAYRSMMVGLAFVFVGIQLVLTAAWTGWSDLAELGVAPEPSHPQCRPRPNRLLIRLIDHRARSRISPATPGAT
jgi:hypothetical protein